MNHRITAVYRVITRGALLAVAWLNLAVMPCAMAFESAEHDCPHCPPAEVHEMAGHHGHGEAKRSCATMQSDCCDISTATVESRTAKSKSGHTPDIVQISGPATAKLSARYSLFAPAADPPDPPGTSPPLYVLNCVYLD